MFSITKKGNGIMYPNQWFNLVFRTNNCIESLKLIYKIGLIRSFRTSLSDNKTNGYSLKEGEGMKINFRGTKVTLKVLGSDSEGRYSLIEMIHPPNTGPSFHIHSNAPEAYYVSDGSYSRRCGDREYQTHHGDFVFISKIKPHNYQSGPQGNKFLVISPAGLEGYFKEVADILLEQKNEIQ